LMIEAQDKNQVLKWSERQLGLQARLISVSEMEISDKDSYVEKGGTGITAREAEVCQPVLSIMANIFENVSDAEEFHMESEVYKSGLRSTGRMPTVH